MKYRKLGNSGLSVSVVSLGTWKYCYSDNQDQLREIFLKAVDKGINYFDTSNNYDYGNSEVFLGELADDIGRDNLVIGTKCFFPLSNSINNRGLSRKHIIKSVEQSLRNLKTDYIDLMQCHRWDTETPIEETISTMDQLIKQGKIRYWGIGACTAAQVVEVSLKSINLGCQSPVSHQHVYNMFNRSVEGEILNYGEKLGQGLLAYSPLAQGILSGKYSAGKVPEKSRAAQSEHRAGMWDLNELNLEKAGKIAGMAANLNITPTALALAWCLRNNMVSSVITYVQTIQQLNENLSASELMLENEWIEKIENILNNRPYNIYTKKYTA